MITFKSSGDFSKATEYLTDLKEVPINILAILGKYGREGVDALSSATPVDSGLTANSWSYEAFKTPSSIGIQFHNSNRAGYIAIWIPREICQTSIIIILSTY